jgi:hypothetical protein
MSIAVASNLYHLPRGCETGDQASGIACGRQSNGALFARIDAIRMAEAVIPSAVPTACAAAV